MVPSMIPHLSRAQWAQVLKRAKQAKFRFDPTWKCILCGSRYSGCDHTAEQNEAVLEEIQKRVASV